MTSNDIVRLRELLRAATPTPWINGERVDECAAVNESHADIYHVSEGENCTVGCATFSPADAELVVAAVNALPELLDELEKLRIVASWARYD